jgi:hypothetical protein
MAATVVSSAQLPESLLLGIEAAGVLLLLLALLLARSRWVVPAVVAVAIPAGAALALRGPAQWAPILGAVLLASAELAFWSIERATPARESVDVGIYRGVSMVGLCLAGCGAGLLVAAVSDLPISGGFDLTAIGIVAAVGISVGLWWLVRDALRSGVGSAP